MSVDIYTNNDLTYDSYLEPDLEAFAQQILPTTAITSINGLTGPTITFSGGTTGLSFTPAGATITLAGTLVAANGGTGISSYAVGDIIYASAATTLSKLADVAMGNALISGGVTTAPAWGKIGLTTHVSGTLGVGNGGTGTATTFTQGSVVFAGASGIYTQDNSNLFWDDSNNRLGVGTASPSVTLHGIDEIACTSAGTPIISAGLNTTNGGAALRVRGASSGNNNWQMANNYNGGYFEITPSTAAGGNTYTTPAMVISNSSFVGIGITAPKSKLHIEGASGWIIADEQDTDPTSTELDSLDSMAIYMKNDKFVIAFNNAGTITYIKIPMDGSTTTWTQDTSAP